MIFGEYIKSKYFILDRKDFKDVILEIYDRVYDIQEINVDNRFFSKETMNVIIEIFEKKLDEIYTLRLKFDETSRYLRTRLYNILSMSVFKLVQQFKSYSSLSDKELEKELNSSYSENQMSYSGIEFENENDGSFNINRQKNNSTSKPSYINFINRIGNHFGNDIIYIIKRELVYVLGTSYEM